MDDSGAGWRSIRLWSELALVVACGRVLLALLPPGHFGSHRLRHLPVTLAVSTALGGIVQRLVVLVEPEGRSATTWTTVGFAAVAAVAWSAGPRAFVAQREPPAFSRSALETAAHVAVLAACFVVILAGRAPWAVPIVVTSELVLHALAITGRRALGAAVMVILLVPLPALAALDATHFPGMLAALGAGSLIAWLRRADRRGRALAAIGYAALAAISLPSAAAGTASAVFAVHRHARKAFAREIVVAIALIAAPSAWLRTRIQTSGPSAPWPSFSELGARHVAPAIAFVLALAVLAGWRGRATASAAEARPVAMFLALAVVLHALAAASPSAGVLGARSWDGIVSVSLPAGALLAGLLLVPARANSEADPAP
jgi:hypothetical protein